MWRRALTPLLLVAMVAPGAQAQDVNGTVALLDAVSHDIQALSVNAPIWIAQHLPATMPTSSIGAAPEHEDGPGFSIGVILPRLGLFNQFNEVGAGTDFLGFEDELPANMFWPQFGLVAALRLGMGLELALTVEGIPNLSLGGETATVEVENFNIGGHFRWRLTPAVGPLPGLVVGVGAAYSTGVMKFGVNGAASYSIPLQVDDGVGDFTEVTGTYAFTGGPEMRWAMTQVAPEVRLVWVIGPFKPFVGLGVGITEGEVQGGAEVTTLVTVDTGSVDLGFGEQEIDGGLEQASTSTDLFRTTPARFTVRPHAGVDIDLGALAIALQVDMAILNNEQLSSDVDTSALKDFDPNQEGGVFGDASKKSQTSAAVVVSLAMRVLF
jgi:hypothetical protein